MSVNTKTVPGRRVLSYGSYDDLLDDVNRLAAGEVECVGNWSLAQVCKHLAVALHGSIDGVPFRAPWLMRQVGKLTMKKTFLSQTLPAGFKIPSNAKRVIEPDPAVDLEEQLAALREAIARVQSDKRRAAHPFFDELTTEEWDQFNLRHAELHMSFVHSADTRS